MGLELTRLETFSKVVQPRGLIFEIQKVWISKVSECEVMSETSIIHSKVPKFGHQERNFISARDVQTLELSEIN